MTAIATATNTTFGMPIPAGVGPYCVAITPDGRTAYVTDETANAVTPIDLTTGTPGTAIAVGNFATGIAITPDGQTAYVTNVNDNTVTPINLSTNAPGTPIPVGRSPYAVAITPDGRTAYVTDYNGETVTPINTATNTAGTPISAGQGPFALAITPDGKTAYVGDRDVSAVTPIDLATGTARTAIPVGTAPYAVAITPDGRTVDVANLDDDTVTPIDVATNTAGAAIPVGQSPEGLAITPDQAPTAAFSVTAAPAGQPSSFDGSASTSPVGSIASYQWDFGDGQTATSATALTSHVYAQSGAYTARLTVTNTAGTSLSQVFTGQTVSNQGGPQATTTQPLTVATMPAASTPAPTSTSTPAIARLSGLRVLPRHASIVGRLAHRRCVKPNAGNDHDHSCRRALTLHVSYTLTAATTVTFSLASRHAGRDLNGRCITASAKNRQHKRCIRTTRVPEHITRDSHAGANHISLTTTIADQPLSPGTYQLTATPSHAPTQTTTFSLTG